MTKKELRNTIINILFDKDFAGAIADSNTEFSDLQLCALCFRYARTYDQRLNLLTLVKVNTEDEKLSDYISRLTEQLKNEAADFCREDENCVYELQIMLDKYAYTERYLCRDAKSAMELIPKWHEHYGDAPKDVTEYIIEKRRIQSASDDFSEDSVASCFIDSNGTAYKYWSSRKEYGYNGNSCEGECTECTREYCVQNIDIPFPDVFETGELVYYAKPFREYGYGVVIKEHSDSEEYYIIPLDGRNICYDLSKAYLDHTHIPKPYVRSADLSEIDGGKGSPGKLYREYFRYLKNKT